MLILVWAIGAAAEQEPEAILAVVRAYTTALYTRDYAEAYRWIAEADRRLKSQTDYERDNDPFTGAALVLARRLAQEIVIRDPVIEHHGRQAHVRARLSLPNGNAAEVSRLLFAEGGFAEPPLAELGERMARLETLIASGNLPTVEVEETWTLVHDPQGWRVFLDWGSGVRITFATQVPKGLDVSAAFDRAQVLTPRGEAVQLRLTVRNHAAEPLRLKVVHRVEPAALERQLDLVQCGYLLPRDLAGGGMDESPVVYFVDEDVPRDVTQLRVILEFIAVE
jgi:hypothetical protein